jgi:hypothetical protein
MKPGILALALAGLLLSFTPCFPQQPAKLIELQDFEPAFIDDETMLSYEGRLARAQDFYLYTKDPFQKRAGWNRGIKIKPEDFQVRIGMDKGTKIVDIPFIRDIFLSKDSSLAAFTIAFGASPNTSVGVVDLKKNALIYAAGLKQKKPGAKGPPQIAMEHVWFNPCLSADGRYIVCDGFKGDGSRCSAIIGIEGRKIEDLNYCAIPKISGEDAVFVRLAPGTGKTEVMKKKLSGGKMEAIGETKEPGAGLEMLSKKGYLITDSRIFSFEPRPGAGLTEIYDYSAMKKGYQVCNVERTYSGFYKGKGYIFLAIKRFKKDKYEWKLYGLEVE